MAKKPSLSGDHLDIEQIKRHFLEINASLQDYFSQDSGEYETRFIGYKSDEVRQQLQTRLDEHDKTCSLMVLAALEAFFRIDYAYRVFRREKDDLSKEFRRIDRQSFDRKRVSLENEIFQAWRIHSNVMSINPQLLEDLKTAFKYRHWLAHGRYWNPKLGRKHDFGNLLLLAENVLASFPLILE